MSGGTHVILKKSLSSSESRADAVLSAIGTSPRDRARGPHEQEVLQIVPTMTIIKNGRLKECSMSPGPARFDCTLKHTVNNEGGEHDSIPITGVVGRVLS
jgi:hypothetical protein